MLASIVWPAALTGVVAAFVATIGFNPTDEGLVLTYGYRILHGQVPHLDFISPRPIGSSVLHLIDFLVPGPLLLTSRLIALTEITATALLFGALVFRRAPARWNVWQIALVAIAFVVDLHTFPLMAWYTIDGILLSLGGLVLVRAEGAGTRRRWLGLLLCGVALTTKQSFFFAPVAATFIVAWPCLRIGGGVFVRRFISSALISAIPGVVMVGVLLALGAGPAMRTQLLNAGQVDWLAVLGPSAFWAIPLVGAVVVALLVERLTRKTQTSVVAAARRVSPLLLVAAAVVILIGGGLSIDGDWGNRLVIVLLAYVAVSAALTRRRDVDAELVLVIAWMASLSWGYAVADLAAGGIVLTIAWRAWTLVGTHVRFDARTRAVLGASALVVALVAVVWGVHARQTDVYRDQPAAQLTANLSTVAPGLAGLMSTPMTLRYLDDLQACVREHPATSVAVLPDNPSLYMLMGWHDPFPIDWMLPGDSAGSEARLVQSARTLNAKGDYLVLFETFPVSELAALTPASYTALAAEVAANPDMKLPYTTGVLQQIRDQFTGGSFACATFIAVYEH